MRKIFLAVAVMAFFASCGTGTSNKPADTVEAVVPTAKYNVEALLSVADTMVGKDVTLTGFVTHTCSHSGRKCFIKDDATDKTIRVEATGDIQSFPQELVGSKVAMTGTLQERRLTPEEIAEMEAALTEKAKEAVEGAEESCETEAANIKMMREWMAANGKDYYAIYYMDGKSYEVIE